jgi:hypothetical protein
VHEIAVEAEFLRLGIADAAAELSRQAFLDVVIDVHQVRAAGTGLVSNSTFSTYGRRCMRSLERSIAEFDSQPPSSWRISRRSVSSLIADVVEIDVPHVNAVARLDEERQRHGLLVVVGVGTGSILANA